MPLLGVQVNVPDRRRARPLLTMGLRSHAIERFLRSARDCIHALLIVVGVYADYAVVRYRLPPSVRAFGRSTGPSPDKSARTAVGGIA